MVGDRAGVPVVPVGDPSEGFLGSQIDGMGSPAQLLWGEVDVFSEGLANALVDGIFDQDPVFFFGGKGGAREVAGEAGTGQAS